MKTFLNKLRRRQRELKLSDFDIVGRMKVFKTYDYLDKVYSGEKDPELYTFLKLIDALKLNFCFDADYVNHPNDWWVLGSVIEWEYEKKSKVSLKDVQRVLGIKSIARVHAILDGDIKKLRLSKVFALCKLLKIKISLENRNV